MKVCIFDEGFIPGLGKGPFKTPIEIDDEKFYLYKRMGLQIINAEKNIPIAESGVRNRVKTDKNEVKLSDVQEAERKELEAIKKNHENSMKKAAKLGIVIDEEPTVEETVEDEVVVTVVEDTDEVGETVEELVEVDGEFDEEVEVDINNLTKKELIEFLTENGVECNNTMTKGSLVKLAENL